MPTSSNVTFLAGKAEAVITPPAGAPTLGTIQRSTDVHDDLCAKCLLLNDGKQRIVIFSLDLIGMDFALVEDIRKAIAEKTGITFTLINCSHNHSAPFTIPWSVLGARWLAGPGKNWRDGLIPKFVKLVLEAEKDSEPAILRVSRAPVQIGTNRRLPSDDGVVMKPNPAGAVVPWVDVLRVDRANGTPKVILFSHAAHPVIIHGSSREISAEFPGFAARKLKALCGTDVLAMFGQSFGANINGDPLRGGIAAAQHAGDLLAEAAFTAYEQSDTIRSGEFITKSLRSSLLLQPLPSREDCLNALKETEDRLMSSYGRIDFSDQELWDMQDEVGTAKSQSESKEADDVQPMEGKAWWMVDTMLCLRDLLQKIDMRDESALRFDTHILRVGNDWSLLAATHELFAEYQLRLDKHSPTFRTMMLAYTNGCEGYIPMDKDLALGGYEAATFPADGAALRYPYRRALRPGFETQVMEQLQSLWS